MARNNYKDRSARRRQRPMEYLPEGLEGEYVVSGIAPNAGNRRGASTRHGRY